MPVTPFRHWQRRSKLTSSSSWVAVVLLVLLKSSLGDSFAMSSAASNTVAVVTGSNKGIGLEILKKVAPHVGVAILAARNEELGKAAAAQLQESGLSNVVYRPLDLSSSDSIARFADGVEKEYGTCSILVNNGAIAFKGSDPTPFRDQAEPTLKTNFFGTVDLTERMLPLLRASQSPARIVNVASQSGYLRIMNKDRQKQQEFASPQLTKDRLVDLMRQFQDDAKAGVHAQRGWPNTCYGMSKLGVIAYTRVLAREEAERAAKGQSPVFVACCCPGYCSTDMSSHGGPRSAEVGARTPAWLALGGSETPGGFYFDVKELQW